MSHVTTIILHLGLEPPESLAAINAYFDEYPSGLTALPDAAAGGNKNPQADLFYGAFSALDIAAFLAHVDGVSLHDVAAMQLFVKDEHDLGFAVYSRRLGTITQELATKNRFQNEGLCLLAVNLSAVSSTVRSRGGAISV